MEKNITKSNAWPLNRRARYQIGAVDKVPETVANWSILHEFYSQYHGCIEAGVAQLYRAGNERLRSFIHPMPKQSFNYIQIRPRYVHVIESNVTFKSELKIPRKDSRDEPTPLGINQVRVVLKYLGRGANQKKRLTGQFATSTATFSSKSTSSKMKISSRSNESSVQNCTAMTWFFNFRAKRTKANLCGIENVYGGYSKNTETSRWEIDCSGSDGQWVLTAITDHHLPRRRVRAKQRFRFSPFGGGVRPRRDEIIRYNPILRVIPCYYVGIIIIDWLLAA